MASLIGKLGGTISGKMSDFSAGFKAAAISGNPVLFGAALKGIEKAFEKNTKEVQKDREERKRKEQFDEENKNEQMKVFSDIQKTLNTISDDVKKILEAMTGKKAEKGGFLDGLRNAILSLLAFFKSIPAKIAELFGKVGKFLSGILEAFKANLGKILGFLSELADALKARFAKLLQFFDDLFSKFPSFDDIFRFIRGKFDDAAKFFDDIFKALKTKLAGIGKFFDNLFDAFKLKFPGVTGFVASVGAKIAQLFDSVMNVFDDVMKSIRSSKIAQIAETSFARVKNFFSGIIDDFVARLPRVSLPEFKLPELPSFNDALLGIKKQLAALYLSFELSFGGPGGAFEKIGSVFESIKAGFSTTFETIKSGFSKVLSFFEPIVKFLAELTLPTGLLAKLGPVLLKALKVIPIIGEIVMVLEGLFVAFDTEKLAEIFYKLPSEVTFTDRLMGFVAGVVGSFFGLIDLLLQGIDWAFGTAFAAKEGEESIQQKMTKMIGRVIMDVVDFVGGIFNVLVGALTFDGAQIRRGVDTLKEIVGDYINSISNFTNRMFAAMYDFMAESVPSWLPGGDGIKGWLRGKAEENRASSNQVSERQQRLTNERNQRSREQFNRSERSSYGNTRPAPAPAPRNTSAAMPDVVPASSSQGGGLNNLNPRQKQMAQLIYDRFIGAGFSDAQAQAAVVNAWYESRLDPNAYNVSAREASYGLFQMNTRGGLGTGYTQAQLSDPAFNIDLAIAQAKKTGGFTSATDVGTATSAFTTGVMRPANMQFQAQQRAGGANSVLSALGITAASTQAVATASQNTAISTETVAQASENTAESTQRTAESNEELVRVTIDSENRQVATARQEAEDRQVNTDAVRAAEAAIVAQNNQQQQHYRYVVQNDAETMRYMQERAGLEQRFYSQLEQSFRTIIDKLMGGMMTQTTGAGYKASTKFLQQPLQKLGIKIFGKETGGAMGDIFSQLAGSYADQMISQTIGPALGMSGVQSQRAFNNLLSGNYKGFYEDMVFGMTGIATGPRSIIGYEQGALALAKELAMATGAPFSPLFNIGNQTPNQVYPGNVYGGPGGSNAYADSIRVAVGDPMVRAIENQTQIFNQGLNNVTQAIVNPRAVLGQPGIVPPTPTPGGGGMVQIFDQATGQMISVKQSQLPGGSEFVGPPAPGMAGFMERNPNIAQMGTSLLGNLGSRFLGSKLGVNQNTFGGSMAQMGLDVFVQSALTGQNPLAALSNMGPGQLAGMAITKLGTTFGSQMLTDFGGGLSGSAFGGGSSFSQFGSFMEAGNLAAQAGYVVGAIGNAMTSKAIADAFSGGYKSGIGDGIAVIGSFFDPTRGFISGTIAAAWNRAFGRKAPEVEKMGLRGTLSTNSSATNVYQYTDIVEKGGWFRSDKRYTKTAEAEKELITGIQNAIGATKSGILSNLVQIGGAGASNMPANASYVSAYSQLKNNPFSTPLDLNFKGLDEEEIRELLEDTIRNFANAYITSAFGTSLDRFKREGEDLVAAFDRISKATVVLDETMLKLGTTFNDLSLSVVGDVFEIGNAKSVILDKFGGADTFAKVSSSFFQKFYTPEEQATYLKGLSEREMLKSLQAVEFANASIGGQGKAAFTIGDKTVEYGSTYKKSVENYRKFLDDWVISKGGVRNTETGLIDYTAFLSGASQQVADQYMMLIGELSEKFLTGAQAADTLNKSLGTTKEAIKTLAYNIFKGLPANTANPGFSEGGIARGPKTGYAALLHGVEAVVPLSNGREIPVELKLPASDLGVSKTFVNNIVGNGNSAVKSSPTTVVNTPPSAVSGTPSNRVVTLAY